MKKIVFVVVSFIAIACEEKKVACGDAGSNPQCECIQACLALNACGCSKDNPMGCILSSDCADAECSDPSVVRCVLDAQDCGARIACLGTTGPTQDASNEVTMVACEQTCYFLVTCGLMPYGADCGTATCTSSFVECVSIAQKRADCQAAAKCK